MFLGPHHFQQWDRYYENLLNSRVKSVTPLYWGLVDMEVNREGLENGTFMLLSFHGIIPGGTYVNIPESDAAPSSRTVGEHFTPSMKALGVYLAVPVDQPGAANFRLEGGDNLSRTRYSRDFAHVVDENTGDNEREIPVAKKNLRILFSDEPLDGYDCLKIGELERTSSGVISLRDAYIPPCITISASQWLMRITRRLVDLFIAKSDEFREQCREKGDGSYEFGPAELSNFMILQIINSTIPELNHFYSMGNEHPEELFRLLARSTGALTAFSARIRPISLPAYDHEDISSSFGGLEEIIQELLRILSPKPITVGYIWIPLKVVRNIDGPVYEATVADHLFAPTYTFLMSVKGGDTQGDLITEIPRQLKIASNREVDLLIGRALPGIRLNYSPTPPKTITRKSGYFYFTLDPKSDFWEDVRQSKLLAIYVPGLLSGLEIELVAVEETEE